LYDKGQAIVESNSEDGYGIRKDACNQSQDKKRDECIESNVY